MKDPEGHFLGFYEDGDKVPSKFHYYYSIWEEDEHRDKVHRLNNRHIGETPDEDYTENPMTIAEFHVSNSVLMVIYIFVITLTWLPYAISVCCRAISRSRRLRRERREREAEEELLRQIPDRLRSHKSLDPSHSNTGSKRGPRTYRHHLDFGEDDETLDKIARKQARDQSSFKDDSYEPNPSKEKETKLNMDNYKIEPKSSVGGIQDKIKNLFGVKSNRVQPATVSTDAGDKCDPYGDDPLSDESDNGGNPEKVQNSVAICNVLNLFIQMQHDLTYLVRIG